MISGITYHYNNWEQEGEVIAKGWSGHNEEINEAAYERIYEVFYKQRDDVAVLESFFHFRY